MSSQNNSKSEKITKAKAKAIKDKLAKHFKDAKYTSMLAKVETARDQSTVADAVLAELGVDWKLELG